VICKYYAWILKTASLQKTKNDLTSSQNSGFCFKTKHTHITHKWH
jgi:hypothetical protein